MNNNDKEMFKAKLQEHILNIPVGEEVNLEVLLRIILQLTEVSVYDAKQTVISEIEKMLQGYCNSGIIKKEEKRYIRVQRQQELGGRE